MIIFKKKKICTESFIFLCESKILIKFTVLAYLFSQLKCSLVASSPWLFLVAEDNTTEQWIQCIDSMFLMSSQSIYIFKATENYYRFVFV